MSIELKSATCGTGEVLMSQYWDGTAGALSVQLTFRDGGDPSQYACMHLNATQAQELAIALIEFCTGTRKEING